MRGLSIAQWATRHPATTRPAQGLTALRMMAVDGLAEATFTITTDQEAPELNGPIAVRWAMARLAECVRDYDVLMRDIKTSRVEVVSS